MEEVLQRFSHLGEAIFDLLDEKSLETSKKVCISWSNFIDDPNQKVLWIKIIKTFEREIDVNRFISGRQKWSKLSIQVLREFVERLKSTEKDVSKSKASTFYILKNVLLDNQAFYSQNIISYEIHQFLIAFHAINIQ